MFSLKTHNVLDYVGGAFLIICPYLFAFSDLDAPRNVMMISGAALIIYSLMTNYQFAGVRVIPLGVHMTLDVAIGVFVMIAPWILNYRGFLTPGQEYIHYFLGVSLFAMVGLTQEKTEADKKRDGIRFKDYPIFYGRAGHGHK